MPTETQVPTNYDVYSNMKKDFKKALNTLFMFWVQN